VAACHWPVKYNRIGIKVKYIKVKLNEMVPGSFKVFEDE
jgi:hypothetical protein